MKNGSNRRAQVLGRDADAGVGHPDLDPRRRPGPEPVASVSRPPLGMASAALTARLPTTCLNWLMSTWTAGRSGAKSRTISTLLEGTFFSRMAERLVDDLVQVGRLFGGSFSRAKSRMPRTMLPAAQRLVADDLEVLLVLRPLEVVQEQAAEGQDPGQGIVDLVGDARGQAARARPASPT